MVGQNRTKPEGKEVVGGSNAKMEKKEPGTPVKEGQKNAGQNDRDHHGQGRRGSSHSDRGGRGGHFRQRRGGTGGFRGGDRQQRGPSQVEDTGDNGDARNVEMVPSVPQGDRKFTGRCRLFVGNLTGDTSEEEFKELFKDHGEFSEVFINPGRGFGFIKMDTRQNAERAKAALDGIQHKGRMLRVRFAAHGAALKVKHVPTHVSNEILEQAFSQFGDVERAVVIVDDRGRSIGEGIVEFARKPGAISALNRINNGVFIMGTCPRPIIVEPLEQRDEDGLPEKFAPKNQDILKERENPPRFAAPGSFEFEFGQKWKELYQMEVQQQEQLKIQIEEAVTKIEMDMETAQHEHQTMLLRQDLMRRQEELRRLEEQHSQELNRRMAMRRQEEERQRDSNDMRRQELLMRQQQEEEMRRRQMEHGMQRDERFSQERGMGRSMERDMGRDMGRDRGNAPPMQPPPAPPAALGLDRPRGQSGMEGGPGMGPGNNGGPNMGQGNMGGMNSPQMRQSRFDQPPQGNEGGSGGGFGQMGGQGMGGPGGNMGGPGMGNAGNMGGPGGQGPPGGMGRGPGGHMQNERMMDRRDHRDEYFENKRPRRF